MQRVYKRDRSIWELSNKDNQVWIYCSETGRIPSRTGNFPVFFKSFSVREKIPLQSFSGGSGTLHWSMPDLIMNGLSFPVNGLVSRRMMRITGLMLLIPGLRGM